MPSDRLEAFLKELADALAARGVWRQRHHHDRRPHVALNLLLAASCGFTLLATSYLSLSVLILRPPRLNYSAWFMTAVFFIAQSAMTLVVILSSRRETWLRSVLVAGGVALVIIGARWAHETVSGAHFEGYALVLGCWIVVQGALTVLRLLPISGWWMTTQSN